MTDSMIARHKVRAHIAGLLAGRNDTQPFTDDDLLIDGARLDSLATTQIVTFLEAEFGADFFTIDFDPDRFNSVNRIVAMLNEMRLTA